MDDTSSMQGVLLVDKPAGWTSFDVVNYVRKLVAQIEGRKPKQVKVGHTGTLDPFATGLLVLLIGKNYTRRAGELSKLDKTYEVTLRLGHTSTTGDPEGEITPYHTGSLPGHSEQPTRGEIEAALQKFTGEIKQIPPAYSAIKVDGQRAYKLARAGKVVKIEPRKVRVDSIRQTAYQYPEVTFVAEVSSGTYIRTLVEDFGEGLGTGAYTSALRRTKVGSYSLESAKQVAELKAEDLAKMLTNLL